MSGGKAWNLQLPEADGIWTMGLESRFVDSHGQSHELGWGECIPHYPWHLSCSDLPWNAPPSPCYFPPSQGPGRQAALASKASKPRPISFLLIGLPSAGSIASTDLLTLRLFVKCSNGRVLMCIDITMGGDIPTNIFLLVAPSVAYALDHIRYCFSTEYVQTSHGTCAGRPYPDLTGSLIKYSNKQHFVS